MELERCIQGYLECDGIVAKIKSMDDINDFLMRFGKDANMVAEVELDTLTSVDYINNINNPEICKNDDCGAVYRLSPLTICKGPKVTNYNIENGTIAVANGAFNFSDQYVSETNLKYREGFMPIKILHALQIPKSVLVIGNHAFAWNENLSNVKVFPGILKISDCAFFFCVNLETFAFPKTLLYIGASAFKGCALKTVSIPASVKSIGSHAFAKCTTLKSVIFEGTPEHIGSGIFDDCPLESIIVPTISIDFFREYLFPIPVDVIHS